MILLQNLSCKSHHKAIEEGETLEKRVSTGVPPPPCSHPRDIWQCLGTFLIATHEWVLLSSRGWSLGKLLNILQRTGQPSTTNNYPAPNVHSWESQHYEISFGKHWFVWLMTDFLTPKKSIQFPNGSPSTWPLFSMKTHTLVTAPEAEQG